MTVHDVERAITEDVAKWSPRADATLRGIRAAQRGIVRLNTEDDGLPVNNPVRAREGKPVIPPPDEAARHLRGYLERLKVVHAGLAALNAYADLYERLGLEPLRDDFGNIVTQHPDRWASPDERKLARLESIDDDECISCRRVDQYSLAGASGLCGRCTQDLEIAKAVLVEQGNPKRAEKLSLPPAAITEQRARGKNVRLNGDDFRAALTTAATKRRAKSA